MLTTLVKKIFEYLSLICIFCLITLGCSNKDKHEELKANIITPAQDYIEIIEGEKLRKQLTVLIDEDTNAFNDVIKAFKMPKETEQQKAKRSRAIQEGYKKAMQVPLETARCCVKILDIAFAVAEKGNRNSITDAGVAALMANAGVQSAILNVQINLGSIKGETFVNNISKEISEMKKTSGISWLIITVVNPNFLWF